MLHSRRHIMDRAMAIAVVPALLAVAAIPAAAQARTFEVDGRVTAPPTAKGAAVTVPLKLTKRAGRALKLGTRSVRVRLGRAGLPLSGAGAAGASVLAPGALGAGDRLRGVTSLSKKARLRLRYHSRPTLKLKRARVIRAGRRANAPPRTPAAPAASPPAAPPPPAAPAPPQRTAEQVLRDIGARVTALSGRVGRYGSLTQQIAAQRLQTLRLPVSLAGVTVAFQSLTKAVEARSSTDPAFKPLLADVKGLAPGVEWLEMAMGAVDTSFRTSSVLRKVEDPVEVLAVEMLPTLAPQIGLIQLFPGLLAQLNAIDEALSRIDGLLDTVEAALGPVGPSTRELNAGMDSLTNAVNALATAAESGADLASLSAGVDALTTDVASLASGFGALQTSTNDLARPLGGLHAEGLALTGMVEALDNLGIGGG
jgi:outer membrane murein-binding lipoprotein Lpp